MQSSWNTIAGYELLAPFAGAADLAVVLGSGFAGLSGFARIARSIDYRDIPAFPEPTVAGHQGFLALASYGMRRVLLFSGRSHVYEGGGVASATAAVSLAAGLGCTGIILTNAAGSCSARVRPGTLMLPVDVLPFPSRILSPLVTLMNGGERIGGSELITRKLRESISRAAEDAGVAITGGVLAWMQGPSYETAAEARAALAAGADAATMSVFPELVASRELGIESAVLSWITNFTANISGAKTDHASVMRCGSNRCRFIAAILERLPARGERA